MLTLILTSVAMFAFNIHLVRTVGTIYIRADGNIDPPTAPILTVDNITYIFTDNIKDSVIVERNNIVVDGAGYTVQSTGSYSSKGIDLSFRSNVTIKNMQIKGFFYGVYLFHSSDNNISGNNITNNGYGILFDSSSINNSVIGSNIVNNECGVYLFYSSNNNISRNFFVNDGLLVYASYENVVSDNLVNDEPLVYLEEVSNYAVENAGQVILVKCNNITVKSVNLSKTTVGVQLYETKNSTISESNITNNGYGVYFRYSSGNSLLGNTITNNYYGIYFPYLSNNNTIFGNTITNNHYGIYFDSSSNNRLSGNNFVNNNIQVHSEISENFWDDGYPSGGNYWSNYAGIDLYSGPYQNETGSDGICDSFYNIDENNQDNYPLMGIFYDFEVVGLYGEIFHVQVISNSTVSELNLVVWLSSPNEYLQPGQEFLQFYVEGENATRGFCRVTIPRALLNDSYVVLVDCKDVPTRQLDASNSTHAYLYFTYNHTKHEVIIIPEFTLTQMLPLFLTATLIIVISAQVKAKQSSKPNFYERATSKMTIKN
jgi:parallel beta-helix repeat protein